MTSNLMSLLAGFFQDEEMPDEDYLEEMSELEHPDKRAWNSGFQGALGKRAWNSGFQGALGKRAWNSGI